jgi:5'-nucleotidase
MNLLLRSLGLALAAACFLQGCATRPQGPIELNLVAINDFHGHLEANKFVLDSAYAPAPVIIQAGGIDHIGAALKAWRLEDRELMFVGAGDLVGASPGISSMWADEPTITALTKMGMLVSSVGNHEFDQGRAELLRQQNGGCESRRADKACRIDGPFKGAGFTWLAANVIDQQTGKPLLPAYRVIEVKGLKVALIGAVLRNTPALVLASGIEGLAFTDEADAINKAKAAAQAEGANVFVVLIHEGGYTDGPFDDADCTRLNGPIVGIVRRLDPALRLIISGHTHKGFQCTIEGRTITQAETGGHVLTRIKVQIDPATHAMGAIAVRNVAIREGEYAPDPEMSTYLNRIRERSDAALARPVARVARQSISKKYNEAGEALLGDIVADGALEATRALGSQIAFMNIGGIRKDLDVRPDLTVTHGQANIVLPYANTLVILDLTGAQLRAILEQQWKRPGADSEAYLLQVSKGFSYTWDKRRPLGQRIVPGTLKFDGVPLDDARVYKVTVNNFLAEGGDGFPQFTGAAARHETPVLDLDAFVAFLVKQEKAGTPAGGDSGAARIERIK